MNPSILFTLIVSSFKLVRARTIYLANEAAKVAVTLLLPNQLLPPEKDKDHWVQLSPFGDFGNVNGKARIIQRFRKEDAESICNSFNGSVRKVVQPLGMPFYIGHPDHPRFSGQPGHEDTRAYGRGKEMAVRHDPACAACASFANAKADEEAAPCHEHGLFVKMHWNDDGARLISNESFHGHSVNWAALPEGMEGGVQVYRPVKVKSAGFTNEPNIHVRPASLANAEAGDGEDAKAVVPPKLKLIAGFKEDEDVTMEQIIAALEKAKKGIANSEAIESAHAIAAAMGLVLLSNDEAAPSDQAQDRTDFIKWMHELLGTDPASGADGLKTALQDKVQKAGLVEKVKKAGDEAKKAGEKHWKARQDLEKNLGNERKARAVAVVDGLVKSGKVVTKDRDTAITDLCNAGDKFDDVAAQLAAGKTVVKTEPKSKGLANAHAKVVEGERERTAKFQQLMDAREKEFPNESYEERFRTIANSGEGAALFAQMKKQGEEE